MKKVLVIFVLIAFNNFAQNIQGTKEECAQLEQLVKQKIDSVRQKHKRSILEDNEILYQAALHHSDYIKSKGKLSHTETTKDFKTPQDRANHYGASNLLVGENVLFTDYAIKMTTPKGKKYLPNNLETLANLIVELWIESPDHYKNMLMKEYTQTAVAVSFDKENKRVYATQLFAYQFE